MALSSRERVIVMVTGLAAVVWAGDAYVLTPYINARKAVSDERKALVDKLHSASQLFAKQRRMEDEWKQMVSGGVTSDPAEAERNLLVVRDWAQEAGLTNLSTTPRREPRNDQTQVVRLDASAVGNLASVVKLLWRVESARLPLKVDDLDLRSRADGTDDLAVSFKVSTIWVTPGEPTGKAPGPRPVRTPARNAEDL
jgi:hypothetical protein